MMERPTVEGRVEAARLAVAIHRDRLRDASGILEPLRKLLAEVPADEEAIDALLDPRIESDDKPALLSRACRALLDSLAVQSPNRASALRLVRLARSLGNAPLERTGLGVLRALGATNPGTEQAFARLAAQDASAPRRPGGASIVAGLRAPGDDGPFGDLFALVDPLSPKPSGLRSPHFA